MKRNCENCYWKDYRENWCIYKENKPKDNLCEEHNFKCKECGDLSEYKYNEEYYCENCLRKELKIEEYNFTQYYKDGEFLGDENDGLLYILNNIDENIELI